MRATEYGAARVDADVEAAIAREGRGTTTDRCYITKRQRNLSFTFL